MQRKRLSVVVSLLSIFLTGLAQTAVACSDIFVNHAGTHIEARSMDFGMNIALDDAFGFIGQENTTDVVLDAAATASERTGVGVGIIIAANRTRHPLQASTLARLAAQYAEGHPSNRAAAGGGGGGRGRARGAAGGSVRVGHTGPVAGRCREHSGGSRGAGLSGATSGPMEGR